MICIFFESLSHCLRNDDFRAVIPEAICTPCCQTRNLTLHIRVANLEHPTVLKHDLMKSNKSCVHTKLNQRCSTPAVTVTMQKYSAVST